MGSFEFMSAGRVVFGRGVLDQVPSIALRYGRRALVVTGRSALGIWSRTSCGPSGVETAERKSGPPEAKARRTSERAVRRARDSGSGAIEPDSAREHVGAFESISGGALEGKVTRPRGSGLDAIAPAAAREHTSTFERLTTGLESAGIGVVPFLVSGEPTTFVADDGARSAIAAGCELVIGLGGGSVLDAAKAISGLMTNGGGVLDYLEIVGKGRSIENPAAPFIAIPTTAGTGSEVTKNAVLTEPSARVKASIRSPLLLPRVALVDPDLTRSLPPAFTASTGLDALTQLIEAYLTPRATPITDLFALDGIVRSARSLLRAVEDGSDPEAREDLALASLFGGFALANAGLGAVHGIAAPLGGRHPVPHGVACAVLLPHVFETNLRALRRADPSSPALARMARVGEVFIESFRSPGEAIHGTLEDETDEPAEFAARLLHFIVSRCRLPGLASHGVTPEDVPAIVEGALRASSMKGNPIALSSDELTSAIVAAF